MSQCVSCANQPSDNDSLGGAAHEGAVTPMVVGIIVGTVAVFILVVCALFYCVKLENNKYMAKLGPEGPDAAAATAAAAASASSSDDEPPGGGGHLVREAAGDGDGDRLSAKSRPSSVTIVPSSSEGGGGCAAVGLAPRAGVMVGAGAGGGNGGKRRLFAWGKKSGESPIL